MNIFGYLLCAVCIVMASAKAFASNLVILQYHHVSDQTPAITSVTPQVFSEHMQALSQHYTVVDLADALTKIRQGKSLPEYAVAITFDDGYANILANAHPILQQYGFAYTVFINPAEIDNYTNQLTWPQVQAMAKQGVTFANHTLDHAHLLTRYPNEDDAAWLKRVKKDIDMAQEMIVEYLPEAPKWLAYPFGEYNQAIQDMLSEMAYVGFGQQSGAVGPMSDFSALPRYPASGRYAQLDSLTTKLNSLAMPVRNVSPDTRIVEIGDTVGQLDIELIEVDFAPERFACYFQGNKLPIEHKAKVFSTRIDTPFTPGRTRINCTAPSLSKNGRFYWFSLPWFTPTEDGDYLD